MSQKDLTTGESLQIISEMISQAKMNYAKGGSFYFLLWGWTIMLANFGFYYLARFTDFDRPYFIWLITIPAGIGTIIYSMKLNKKALVTTHLDKLYGQVWMAIGVGIIVILVFMSKINFSHNAIILLLAGIGTYISGQMLKFTPLIYGAIAIWIASIIAFIIPVVDQYLVAGIGIFSGYIIPGYILKRREQ